MNGATWPEVNCPDPHGPTARKHLEYILYKAQTDATSELPRIEKAIEACLRSECLTKDPPQRGKRPPDVRLALFAAPPLGDNQGADDRRAGENAGGRPGHVYYLRPCRLAGERAQGDHRNRQVNAARF